VDPTLIYRRATIFFLPNLAGARRSSTTTTTRVLLQSGPSEVRHLGDRRAFERCPSKREPRRRPFSCFICSLPKSPQHFQCSVLACSAPHPRKVSRRRFRGCGGAAALVEEGVGVLLLVEWRRCCAASWSSPAAPPRRGPRSSIPTKL
jgi:hypothetical protein